MLDEQKVLDAVRRRVEERGEASKLGLPDNVKITWTALLEGEIARQATFKYLQLARAEAPQHPHRVYYVFPTVTAPQVLVLPSRQRTWQIVAAALGALLVLLLILRLVS
ncbi:hypothetical protein SBI_09373 [Streptomyces bingchenggensis BCW-1]|uniref:Uncharacterized protein n=1 Tax=Streptomyces bingchenggensis (strain BCW-1) TaxID=749414 RepID=D7C5W2_STRBB|nr:MULTISPECIES: hypothetical protein [Streptomyces]ADI12491.1 hypothetical protein SBI_09373 [Streptomyces bingchenggensis BCW-1]